MMSQKQEFEAAPNGLNEELVKQCDAGLAPGPAGNEQEGDSPHGGYQPPHVVIVNRSPAIRLYTFAADLLGRRGEVEEFVRWRQDLSIDRDTFVLLGRVFDEAVKHRQDKGAKAVSAAIAREIRG